MVSTFVEGVRPTNLPSSGSKSQSVSALEVSQEWLKDFSAAASTGNAAKFNDLFSEQGTWRDVISFTNDFRSITKPNILQAAKDRLQTTGVSNVRLSEKSAPSVQTPFQGYTIVEAFFEFDTKIGPSVGIVKLIQDPDQVYRAYVLFTTLDGVHAKPFISGANRSRGKHNTEQSYDEIRQDEIESIKPSVIIVGGGHNGLETAAHLKALGIEALVVDRNQRVGDNWRLRYKSLSLHDPVWANHLSYMPFPSTWPIFTPSGKLANWLEHYVEVLELNVWNSSEVVPGETQFDSKSNTWTVKVNRAGKPHVFNNVSHVVMATGLGGGRPKMPPPFKGQSEFKGKVVHSSQHGSGGDWTGKRALVVGSCTSAHDICADFSNNGVDVTMLQRSPTFVMSVKKGMPIVNGLFSEDGPETATADLMAESLPKYVVKLYHQRLAKLIAQEDSELLEGLAKAGFKTSQGEDGSGFIMSAWQKAGGYYFDTGASQKIIDGDIKVQQGEIDHFTSNGVIFKDGSSLDNLDVVVCATGYTGFKDTVAEILGDKYASGLKPIWGLDEEGEIQGVARDCGIPRCLYIVGNLSAARFSTKIAALQVAAEQEHGELKRYTVEEQKLRQ